LPSFLATPWIQNRKQDDNSNQLDHNAHDYNNWEMLWRTVKSEAYFGPFNKFRKANAKFQVRGHELRSFFPQWWPGTQPYPAGVEDRNAQEKWVQDDPNIARDLRLAVISLVDRALATTADGHLALVPNTTKNGDIIAIVDCPFPIVLRPKEQGYEYVGECYLHGFMDGEAFVGDHRRRVEELSIQ
jgi:hypothetical protein